MLKFTTSAKNPSANNVPKKIKPQKTTHDFEKKQACTQDFLIVSQVETKNEPSPSRLVFFLNLIQNYRNYDFSTPTKIKRKNNINCFAKFSIRYPINHFY